MKKIGIGSGSCGLGFGAGSLWIEDTSSSTISRVSATHRQADRGDRPSGIQPYDATFAFGAAWATVARQRRRRADRPGAEQGGEALSRSRSATGVVGAFGSIWATGQDGVIRIDPATDQVVATIPIAGGAGWTAASADAVWVTTTTGVARIDPATNSVAATIALGTPALGDPAVVAGKLWVPKIRAERDRRRSTRRRTRSPRRSRRGSGPFVVTEIAGEAWIPSWQGRDIWRVKP